MYHFGRSVSLLGLAIATLLFFFAWLNQSWVIVFVALALLAWSMYGFVSASRHSRTSLWTTSMKKRPPGEGEKGGDERGE